jgi:hypothetical protein
VPSFQMRVPEGLAWAAGYAAEWVSWATGSEGVMSRGLVSDGCRDRYVSIAKAKMVLGYTPRVGLEEGIRISCAVGQVLVEWRCGRGLTCDSIIGNGSRGGRNVNVESHVVRATSTIFFLEGCMPAPTPTPSITSHLPTVFSSSLDSAS